jgi:hypothetical protein
MLVVAAHMYAITVAGPSVVSNVPYSSSPMARKQGWILDPLAARSLLQLATPVQEVLDIRNRRRAVVKNPHGDDDDDDSSDGQQQQQSEQAIAASNLMLLKLIFSSDPATMLFDVAQYLMQDRMPPPPPQGEQEKKKAQEQRITVDQVSYIQDSNLIMLPQMVGIIALPILLIPSLIAPMGAMVPGMAGVSLPGMIMRTTSWPVLNACMACFLASWGFCHWALHLQLGLYKLAVCSSMHIAFRILVGLWSMLYNCPFAPIFLPKVRTCLILAIWTKKWNFTWYKLYTPILSLGRIELPDK